jgi:hypothetical protein
MLPALAAPAGLSARLEGLVLGIDGRPAAGYRVHLVGSEGDGVAHASVDASGSYSFAEVGPGEYALGVETPAGEVALVAAAPVRLGANELARRDIKLVQSDPRTVNGLLAANPSLGAWWGERTTAAKIWTIVGLVAVGGVTFAALDDEEDTSPVNP